MTCAALGSAMPIFALASVTPENFTSLFLGAGLAFTLVYVLTLTTILACHFEEVEHQK